MSYRDIYSASRNLAKLLEESGHDEVAKNIVEAIDTGFSGTEIYMKLHFYICPLALSTSLRADIVDMARLLCAKLKVNGD